MEVLPALVQRAEDLAELRPVARDAHLVVAQRLRRLPRAAEAAREARRARPPSAAARASSDANS
jgi:hypothetical protein